MGLYKFFYIYVIFGNALWCSSLYLLRNSYFLADIIGRNIIDIITIVPLCLWIFAYLPFNVYITSIKAFEYVDTNSENMSLEEIYKKKIGAIILAISCLIFIIVSLLLLIHYLERNYRLPF